MTKEFVKAQLSAIIWTAQNTRDWAEVEGCAISALTAIEKEKYQ